MPGKLKNCPMCGKIFADMGTHVCRDCYAKLQKKESEVVNYVRDNPNSKIPDIVEVTGADEKMIKRMIREGRFVQVGVPITYPCKKCGAPITQGELCARCMTEMRENLQKETAKITAAKQAAKMARGQGMHSMREQGNTFKAKPKW